MGEVLSFGFDLAVVEDRSRNLKFSTHHQDQSMEKLATRVRGGCIFIPLKIAKRKRYKNADEVVVLVAIQIAADSDLSAEQRRIRVQHTCSPMTSPVS